MSQRERPGQAPGGFDPEAEQEVDFARYVRLIGARWWLLGVGLVAGAVIGYLVTLGGSQQYEASASIYLGQPFSSGGASLLTLQQNPAAVTAIAHSVSATRKAGVDCKARPGEFRNGISTENVPGSVAKTAQNPIVSLTVQAKHAQVASCVANDLARQVVRRIAAFASTKITNFERRIESDAQSISIIEKGISSPDVSTTDKLLFQLQLRNQQEDQIAAQQLLYQAQQVEMPQLLTRAESEKATVGRSRRNTVVVAALIGLLLGGLLAVFWDRIVPKIVPSPEE